MNPHPMGYLWLLLYLLDQLPFARNLESGMSIYLEIVLLLSNRFLSIEKNREINFPSKRVYHRSTRQIRTDITRFTRLPVSNLESNRSCERSSSQSWYDHASKQEID